MSLTPGARLGPYEITAQIGVGGMGEVYRATDTNLKRQVAIKVLPASVAGDAERLARFQREAEVLAALNHPHIAAIYGLEKTPEFTALVMELVEGEDLSQRIARGAIPVDEALPIAKQIAEALEAAHEQGIVHRDLKPANIKVRADGTVKVLDFGLAKAIAPEGASAAAGLSMSPTITTPAMTQAGMILGTAAYMSPEQARGRAVDKRADIWAFGAVLFEMLTGTRAFGGEDVAETLANVINRNPAWETLPAMVPAHVRQALRLCLKKAPRERVPDIGAVRLALDGAFETAAPQAPTPTPEPRSRRRFTVALAAAVVAGAVLTALGAWLLRPAPVDTPEVRLQMVTPAGSPTDFAIAPDGRALVFVAGGEGKPRQLWLRSLDSDTAQLLPGTERAGYPFWSPDSRSIGFRVFGVGVKRVDLDGLTTRTIFNGQAVAPAWGADGTILFSAGTTGPLSRVPASGGQPVAATRLESPQQTSHRIPRFLPDGRHFLFYVLGTPEARGVYLGTLDSQETRRLFDADSQAEFVPPDYLMFTRQEALLAQRLNLETFDTIGEPIVFGDATQTDALTAHMALSASSAGSLVYRAAANRSRQLVWFDRSGGQIGSIGEPIGSVDEPGTSGSAWRMSPDGSAVALWRRANGNSDIWLMDTARGLLGRLTSDPGLDREPVWSPDGTRISFVSTRKGTGDIYQKLVSGAAPEELLLATPINKNLYDWSPDGRFILYSVQDPQTRRDLWALPLDGVRTPFVVAQSAAEESRARFSTDGRWIAYMSDETGQQEVFVKAFPTLGGTTQISASGVSNSVGGFPRWSHDGKTIFYAAPDNRLMSVPVTARPNGTLDVGTPVALFTMRPGAELVAAPAVQRFLVNTPLEDAVTTPLTVVLNWKPKRQ